MIGKRWMVGDWARSSFSILYPQSCDRIMLSSLFANRSTLAKLLAGYSAYLIAAAFGQWMMLVHEVSIIIWPPNGIILAFLMASERRDWPGWFAVALVGELTANAIWFHNPIAPALGYVLANVLEILFAAGVLRAYFKVPVFRLTGLEEVLIFLGVAVLGAPIIGATVGSAINAAIGKSDFLITWPFWWLGDATGILLATPFVISAINVWREPSWPSKFHLVEAAGIALAIVGLALWQLSTGLYFGFLLVIPSLWAALRFEMRGAVASALLLAIVIGIHANSSATPASNNVLHHAKLQMLMIATAALGLIVAAIIRQYRRVAMELASTNADLERRVIERTRDIAAAEKRFQVTFENAAVGIALLDPQGRLLRVNESLAKFLGYRVEELEGRALEDFTHPEDMPSHRRAWEQLERGVMHHYDFEKRYRRSDGETVWGHASVSCVRKADGAVDYFIKIIQDVTARWHSDETRQMLMLEVNHRSKNLLAIIQSIARQTASRAPDDFVKTFGLRLQALAANQDLLVESGWRPVDLEMLVRSQLQHFEGVLAERFVFNGLAVRVPARAAQAIGLAIHELGTNAAKYGSLSNDSGRIEINWKVAGEMFEMSWRELGGPQVMKPAARGFGSTVIDTLITTTLNGEVSIEYAPTGLIWKLQCPTAAFRSQADFRLGKESLR
jgi:PAS domain S-box-containing protein